MVDARLRRLCERKPSGKLNVPQAIHDQWIAGGKQRDELRALFESYDFDKDSFQKKPTCCMLCSCIMGIILVLQNWNKQLQVHAHVHFSSIDLSSSTHACTCRSPWRTILWIDIVFNLAVVWQIYIYIYIMQRTPPVNICTYFLHVRAGGFCAQGDQAYRASQGGVTGGSEGLVHPRANED